MRQLQESDMMSKSKFAVILPDAGVALGLFFLCLLLVGCSDPETRASNRMTEAGNMVRQAEGATDLTERVRLLEQAESLIKDVRESYPETSAAQSLNAGQTVAGIAVGHFERELYRARRMLELQGRAQDCQSGTDPLCVYSVLEDYAQLIGGESARRTANTRQAEKLHRQWLLIRDGEYEAAWEMGFPIQGTQSMHRKHERRMIRGLAAQALASSSTADAVKLMARYAGGGAHASRAAIPGWELLLDQRPDAYKYDEVQALIDSRNAINYTAGMIWGAQYRADGLDAAMASLEQFLDEYARPRERSRLEFQGLLLLLEAAYSSNDPVAIEAMSGKVYEWLEKASGDPSVAHLIDIPVDAIFSHVAIDVAFKAGNPQAVLDTASERINLLLPEWLSRTGGFHYQNLLPYPGPSWNAPLIGRPIGEYVEETLESDPQLALEVLEMLWAALESFFHETELDIIPDRRNLYPNVGNYLAGRILSATPTNARCEAGDILIDKASSIAAAVDVQIDVDQRQRARCFAATGQKERFYELMEHLDDPEKIAGLINLELFEQAEMLVSSLSSLNTRQIRFRELAQQVSRVHGRQAADDLLKRQGFDPDQRRRFQVLQAARHGDMEAMISELRKVAFEDADDESWFSRDVVFAATGSGHAVGILTVLQDLIFTDDHTQAVAIDSIVDGHLRHGLQ
jgi:hypothetical protein